MTAVSAPIETTDQTGDFASLVRQHQANLWRYVRYLGAESTEADDLVQETFLAVYRSDFVHQCHAQSASYLRTTARNQLLMLRRRQRRAPSQVQLDAADAVWAETFGDGPTDPYLEALEGCLQHVEGRARQALDQQYTDRLSREQIAERLGMKPAGVKTLLRRTRDTLRDCIERKLA